MGIQVAIDGPAGAGKSTLSKLAAKELEFIYIDTGALYRTVGLSAIKNKVSIKEIEKIEKLLKETKVEMFLNEQKEQIILLNGEDVSAQIRTPEVSMMASDISAVPIVREYLLDLQRNMAKEYNVLMDGRDIGTVILPNADVKIFLTATPQERAKRRFLELSEKGTNITYEEVLQDVITRDYNDSNRKVAPLKQADDAVLLDTTALDFNQSLTEIINIIKNKVKL